MKKRLLPIIIASVTAVFFANVVHAAGPTPEAKALIKQAMQKAPQITPAELDQALKAGKDLVVLDVRQKSERPILGTIKKDDVHIPRGYLEVLTYSNIEDRDAEIVVYCGKGIRSAFAANTLKEMGYTNVKNLQGGLKAWKDLGLSTNAVE